MFFNLFDFHEYDPKTSKCYSDYSLLLNYFIKLLIYLSGLHKVLLYIFEILQILIFMNWNFTSMGRPYMLISHKGAELGDIVKYC